MALRDYLEQHPFIVKGLSIIGITAAVGGSVWFMEGDDQRTIQNNKGKKEIKVGPKETYDDISRKMVEDINELDGVDHRVLRFKLTNMNQTPPQLLQSGQDLFVPDYGAGFREDSIDEKVNNSQNNDPNSGNKSRTLKTSDVELKNKTEDLNNEELEIFIKRYEGGFHPIAYDCPSGQRSIGYGTNLENVKERIEDLGYNYANVFCKITDIEKEDAETLLEEDIETAKKDAKNFLGTDTYENLHPKAKRVVVDMAYNMGYNNFSEFTGFKESLQEEDYLRAAREIIYKNPDEPMDGPTEYYRDVGKRSLEHHRDILEVAYENRRSI